MEDEADKKELETEPVFSRMVIGSLHEAKTSQGIFDLPHGVFYNDELLREVQVSELSGVEEDIMTGGGLFVKRMTAVISNCVKRIGKYEERETINTLVRKMVPTDRGALIIMIRRVTHGDEFPMGKIKCRACGKELENPNANLGTLEAILPKEPRRSEFAVKCPSGISAEWEKWDVDKEEMLANIRKGMGDDEDKDNLTWAVLMRLRQLDGATIRFSPDDFTPAGKLRMSQRVQMMILTVKRMKAKDRNFLRREFATHEGDLDLTVRIACTNDDCKEEIVTKLDIASPDFFFPGETR
jgi:hypothetical protein